MLWLIGVYICVSVVCVLCICPFMCVCVCVSGDCPWSTWSGVGSGSIWQRPRPGWLPGEVAYSFSFIYSVSMCSSCHFHNCFCDVGPRFCWNLNSLVSFILGLINFLLCLSICFSSRVKIDLDIVKKARVVDDVSSDAWEVSDLKVAFFSLSQ